MKSTTYNYFFKFKTYVMFSRKEELDKKCPNCGSGPSWGVLKLIDSAGRDRYPYFCKLCGTRTQCYCKKNDVLGSVLNSDPSIIIPPKKGVCERCGEIGYLERHHWAPISLFDDADNWPTSFLCHTCHAEWHSVMTKNNVR
jgi:formate dehydrogenase maturation protein FdhE